MNHSKFQTLEKEEIWISSIDALNDPYEFSCMYVDHDRLHEAGYPEWIITRFKNLIGNRMKTWGIASLSGNSFYCFPMWAYYANNHHGYCVEYDVIRSDNIHKISYESERISLATVPASLYNAYKEMIADGKESDPEVDFYSTIIMQQLFMKHCSWAHENEYRVVFDLHNQLGRSIPLSLVGLKTSRIVAGINCSDEHYHTLQEISAKIGCGKVTKAKISPTDYVLL